MNLILITTHKTYMASYFML